MADIIPPVLDETKLKSLGDSLFKRWQKYVTDRKMVEERWLRNLRQVRKIYDPEVLNMIPADRSKAYPGLTQWVCRGTQARLMQMLWPQTEKNYGVKNSPLPELSKDDLQQVLDALAQAKAQGGDMSQVTLTDEEIETAIAAFAAGKAERMELKITDDLQEMDIITLARRVVKSGVNYNIGILRGPLHRKVPTRKWQKNQYTGKYEAVDSTKLKPLFEFLPVWDHYFDMTAVALEKQDGTFDRHVMARTEIEALLERSDFFKDKIEQFLRERPTGNYRAQWWESVIKGEEKSATAPVANKEGLKFEALSYWGPVSGHDVRAAGIEVKDEDLGRSFHVNAWMLGDTIIKMKFAMLGEAIRHHHYFVFEEDDLSILGNGQPDVMRDSQLSVCETARAALDNMSVIGPMVEVNDDLLTPGQSDVISKHKTWHREGEGNAASIPAVRNINIESHLTELQALLNMFMMFGEKESGLPPPSVGDVSGGGSEALRTTQNASMFLGAAALPIRDTVRNYDTFTISYISALVAWNKKFDPNASRDGDHDVIARGSTSLIAKEVLARSLDEFRATVSPDELPHLKTRELLVERMKVRDLPMELLEDLDTAKANIKAQQDRRESQEQAATDLIHSQVQDALSNAFKNAALARKADSSIGVDVFESIISALAEGAKVEAGAHKAIADHAKAGAAVVAAHNPAAGGGA